jgi:5-methylcytosine-specific restriction endonuclease McrBC regulatory subunit McrC
LVIDNDLKVAFTRQAETDDLEIPKLLRRTQLTFIDSTLLLYLRQQLAQAQAHDERAVVSKKDIVEHLGMYDKTGNTDKAGFDKRINASIEKMKKHYILQKIRDDRFEVSPALKLLFSAEEIKALTKLYKDMNAGKEEGE